MSDDSARRLNLLLAGALLFTILSGGVAALALIGQPLGLRLVQLGLTLLGLACALIGLASFRRLVASVVRPLCWIAGEIKTMQQTGQWVTVPGRYAKELEAVTSGFNWLAQHLEEQQRRGQEQIVELSRINAELSELATLKEDFLTAINHQLRAPWTAIRDCVRLIRNGALGQAQHEEGQVLVRTLEESVTQLGHALEEVLDLSLLKSGRRALQRHPDDLTALLRQAQENWRGSAQPCAIRLACHDLPPVYMDAAAIQEVMDHLLHHALQHAPQGSEVLIEAHTHNGVAEIAIRDQGPGRSPQELTQLFQPFTNGRRPKAPGLQRNGLGLAFCRQVIERHRGSIRAESSEGGGTTVAFSLPIATKRFLLEEACRMAQEEAGDEERRFGLLVATPAPAGIATSAPSELMRRAEALFRRYTHRGDRFVWVDDLTLVIVAVTDQAGMDAMSGRLRDLLLKEQLYVHLASAVFPLDGKTPERLLEVARNRSPQSLNGAPLTAW